MVALIRFLVIAALGLTTTMCNSATMAQSCEGGTWIPLFDGSSLDAWRGYSNEVIGPGWKIVDGALHLDGEGGDIITQQEFGDFELCFEWMVAEKSNSGVMYRVGLGDRASYYTGPEYQILDDGGHADGKNDLTSAASLYALYAPQNKTLCPLHTWNCGRIVVRGNHVEHWLNCVKVVEAEIGSDDWKSRIANSKFKEWERFATLSAGRICIQDHGDKVWYRNIFIRELSPTAQPTIVGQSAITIDAPQR